MNITPTLDHVLVAIADPTRRAILERLARGPARVTDVAEPFEMSLAGVSKHVRVLERAGLVRRVRRGREHTLTFNCEAAPPGSCAGRHATSGSGPSASIGSRRTLHRKGELR